MDDEEVFSKRDGDDLQLNTAIIASDVEKLVCAGHRFRWSGIGHRYSSPRTTDSVLAGLT